nr:hypothetical protein [uncultured Massilia sp.]
MPIIVICYAFDGQLKVAKLHDPVFQEQAACVASKGSGWITVGLTGAWKIGYDRRLSICSGKDNKAESASQLVSICGTTI